MFRVVQMDRAVLLAHHHPDQRERCVVIGRRPVCRRCLVLYPLLLAVFVATAGGVLDVVPASWREPWLWLLPLPAALEYSGEAFGRLSYSIRRQVLVSVLQAVGGGAGFAWELQAHSTVSFWRATASYGVAALTVTGMGWRSQANRRARVLYQSSLDAAESRL